MNYHYAFFLKHSDRMSGRRSQRLQNKRNRSRSRSDHRTRKSDPSVKLFRQWVKFKRYIYSLPLYYISCHSAVCLNYKDCGNTQNTNSYKYPSFKLPKDTFMINLTNGEFCSLTANEEYRIKNSDDIYKKILLVDFPSDARVLYNTTLFYPTISSVYRSSPGSIVPNYACLFKDAHQDMGVYSFNPPAGWHESIKIGDDIFLDKVINKIGKGIYIFGGCTSPYRSTVEYVPAQDYASSLIYTNELYYRNPYPTMSLNEINRFDPTFDLSDVGTKFPRSRQTGMNLATMANAHSNLSLSSELESLDDTEEEEKAKKLYAILQKK